jgi:transposase
MTAGQGTWADMADTDGSEVSFLEWLERVSDPRERYRRATEELEHHQRAVERLSSFRAAAAAEAYASGKTVRSLAEELAVSPARVHQLIQQAKQGAAKEATSQTRQRSSRSAQDEMSAKEATSNADNPRSFAGLHAATASTSTPRANISNGPEDRSTLSSDKQTIVELREESSVLKGNLESPDTSPSFAPIPVPTVIDAEAILTALPEAWRRALEGAAIAVAPAGTQFFRTEEQKYFLETINDLADRAWGLHQAAAELLQCTEDCVIPDDYQQALSMFDLAKHDVVLLAGLIAAQRLAS